jgi:hypothetical protein
MIIYQGSPCSAVQVETAFEGDVTVGMVVHELQDDEFVEAKDAVEDIDSFIEEGEDYEVPHGNGPWRTKVDYDEEVEYSDDDFEDSHDDTHDECANLSEFLDCTDDVQDFCPTGCSRV